MQSSPGRQRDYSFLLTRLKNRGLFLERDLFVAVLNTISNIEDQGFTKQKAIKMCAKGSVTQKSIREVLDNIDYLTPSQSKRLYSTGGYHEAKMLEDVMSRND
jgi:hypothetical protein